MKEQEIEKLFPKFWSNPRSESKVLGHYCGLQELFKQCRCAKGKSSSVSRLYRRQLVKGSLYTSGNGRGAFSTWCIKYSDQPTCVECLKGREWMIILQGLTEPQEKLQQGPHTYLPLVFASLLFHLFHEIQRVIWMWLKIVSTVGIDSNRNNWLPLSVKY